MPARSVARSLFLLNTFLHPSFSFSFVPAIVNSFTRTFGIFLRYIIILYSVFLFAYIHKIREYVCECECECVWFARHFLLCSIISIKQHTLKSIPLKIYEHTDIQLESCSISHSPSLFHFVSFHYHLRFFFCCSVLSFFLPCRLLNCKNTAIDRYVSFHKMHEEILVVVFFCQRGILCACWMFLGCMWTPRPGHTLQCVYEHCKHAQKAIAFMAAKVHTHANYGWQHVRSSVGIDGWLAGFFRFTLKTYVPHQLTDWLAEI